MSRDAAIALHAARQHALVTLDQALGAGFSADAIRHYVRTGRWHRAHAVFVVNGAPATWEQAAMAAVLAAGPEAVASHSTAGVLWGLPNVFHEVMFELSTPRPHRVRQAGVRGAPHGAVPRDGAHGAQRRPGHQRRSYPDRSVGLDERPAARDRDRLRPPSPAPHAPGAPAQRGGLYPAPGRRLSRSHAVLRARLEHHDESESDLEMRVLRAIVAAGLPEPVQQHWVDVGGKRRRIDLAYPELKLAVEVDGCGPHSARSAFDADRVRENELEIIDWDRLHFTSNCTDRYIAETVAAKLAALGHKPCA